MDFQFLTVKECREPFLHSFTDGFPRSSSQRENKQDKRFWHLERFGQRFVNVGNLQQNLHKVNMTFPALSLNFVPK